MMTGTSSFACLLVYGCRTDFPWARQYWRIITHRTLVEFTAEKMSEKDQSFDSNMMVSEKGDHTSDLSVILLFADKFIKSQQEIERQKIELERYKTDIYEREIRSQSEANQRQHDFYMARLSAEENQLNKNRNFVRQVVLALGFFLATLITSLLLVVFLSENEANKQFAQITLLALFASIGGFGIFHAITQLIRKLTNNNH